MSRENSALIALEELKNLEAQRVQQVEDEVRASEDAQRRAQEAAEQKARAEAEQIRSAQAEQARLAQEEHDRKEREERIRVAEAEARSRSEQEARLREEQMRLDAQVKMAERKKTPYWLYATAGVLTIGLIAGGVGLYKQDQKSKADQIEKDKIAGQLAAKEQELKDLEAKAQELQDNIAAKEAKQAELEASLASASDADKARILAEIEKNKKEQADLDQQLAANNNKRKGGGGGGGSTAAKKPITKERKDKLSIGGGDAPLGGI
jgi:hypothetical protein